MGLSRISRNYEIILNNAKQKGRKDSKLKINLEGGGSPAAAAPPAATPPSAAPLPPPPLSRRRPFRRRPAYNPEGKPRTDRVATEKKEERMLEIKIE